MNAIKHVVEEAFHAHQQAAATLPGEAAASGVTPAAHISYTSRVSELLRFLEQNGRQALANQIREATDLNIRPIITTSLLVIAFFFKSLLVFAVLLGVPLAAGASEGEVVSYAASAIPYLASVGAAGVAAIFVRKRVEKNAAAARERTEALRALAKQIAVALGNADPAAQVLAGLPPAQKDQIRTALDARARRYDPYSELGRLVSAERAAGLDVRTIAPAQLRLILWRIHDELGADASFQGNGTVAYALDPALDDGTLNADVARLLNAPRTKRVVLIGPAETAERVKTGFGKTHESRISVIPFDESFVKGAENLDGILPLLYENERGAVVVFKEEYLLSPSILKLYGYVFGLEPFSYYVNRALGRVVSLHEAEEIEQAMKKLIYA